MEHTVDSPEGPTLSRFQRLGLPLVFVIAMTGLIIFGFHIMIHWAIDRTIRSHAEADTREWADMFASESDGLERLFESSALTLGQQDVVDAAITYGDVYSFVVYDANGRLFYSSDYGFANTAAERTLNENALTVLRTDVSHIQVLQKTSHSRDASVYVDAMVLVKTDKGTPAAVIHLFVDKSSIAAFYASFLNWIGLLLPVMTALLYVVPSIAFVWKREQALARTKRLHRLSRFDTLTGVLNRNTMSQECQKRFNDRDSSKNIGVFFLDVDNFKKINDTNGHEYGDAYLSHMASVLMENVRSTDLVGRMGGDEFVIALPNANPKVMENTGLRILAGAREPFEYKGKTIQSSVSLGYHLADLEMSGKDALRAADMALYFAKTNGRNTMKEYFPELDTALIRRRDVEARMRVALENDEFEIHFQALTNPTDRSVVGFEALLRLNCEDGQPISPVEFIPVAEETGMIHDIGIHTLRCAIKTAKTWPEHIFLSVNLSPAQFQRGDLVEQVSAILANLDFPAERLELEVTESLLMADEERVSTQLFGLKHLGISIAMDDFGTGYSSLGYLWKYDFDKLKIDRVFLEGFDFDKDRYREIIETIVTLGHKMGMEVTIEGVETEQQTEMLQSLNCDQFQGFLFGQPMPANQTMHALIASEKASDSAA